jgi:thiamine pyrophosphokinase
VTAPLLRQGEPVTLVGGGPIPDGALEAALALAPVAVAADGGGDVVLPGGRRFAAVIGDMDSLRAPERLAAEGVPVHRLAEQDTTDLEKCLYATEAPLTLGVGFLDGRVDHHLAAMNALVRYGRKRVILIGSRDVCFLCPPLLEMTLAPGTRVSLFPLAPATGTVSTGLRWSVAGLTLSPAGRIGTSNEALGGTVRVGFDAPVVLAILPRPLLGAVAADLLAGSAVRAAGR